MSPRITGPNSENNLDRRRGNSLIGDSNPRIWSCPKALVRFARLTRLSGDSGPIKIFDKQHIVTFFVVDQFIDELFRQQYAEAAWSQATLFTNRHVAKQILSRVADGCVAKFFERETFAGIPNSAGYRAMRTNERDFYILIGIKICTVLHGID